ncbi:EpsD family peptidyl-prolyl cis-trans isomerase [Uliginosibacterium sp. H1]|uniref:EpsD family peptidyl-prolyl cis-trans isomerase n=1 Tax=Uliginosibacterium sp. H1 TaxID=3114757 RepID=UPI002E174460|nr:EpsD family peptidyl-prolyl cis-trans isomerase [Uliginosibacterium sp. H1]
MSPDVPKCLALVALAASLVACGKQGADAVPASQVAAKVDSREISVHQLNHVLSRAPAMGPEQKKVALSGALDRLIDQELLLAQAVEKKLDRDPRVLQALEAARREVLVRAYAERITGQVARPDTATVREYYESHPDLFERRRVFNFSELLVPQLDGNFAALEQKVAHARDLGEVASWLRAERFAFTAASNVRPAEQIPMEALPRFVAMKDGELMVMPVGQGATVVSMNASYKQPLPFDSAAAYIQQFLVNRAKLETTEAELKRLREQARIEYVGEFARTAPSLRPATPSDVTAPVAVEKAALGLR